jgi:exodeoxyribonuclease V alpha subunit
LGILPDLCDYNDLVIKKFETNELLIKQLKEIYLDEINNKGINNVQVISPYKEGVLGINNLNEILDNVYNKNKTNENFNFKIGSKIVNLVNNYDKDVFNGETGVITEINDETLKATINNKKIDYDLNEKEYIQLANVMTVHRVQGSEYSTVFVILDDEKGNFLLNRKLLYTAVSRGINKVYIFTKNACLSKCVTNTYEEPRLTKLKYFLTGEELPLC